MRKIDFSNFRVSIGTVVRLIVAAGGLWLLIPRRILFFQGNRVIKSNSVMNPAVDIPLETVRRPIFFILLILLLLHAVMQPGLESQPSYFLTFTVYLPDS